MNNKNCATLASITIFAYNQYSCFQWGYLETTVIIVAVIPSTRQNDVISNFYVK